jgi:hypothetical protein
LHGNTTDEISSLSNIVRVFSLLENSPLKGAPREQASSCRGFSMFSCDLNPLAVLPRTFLIAMGCNDTSPRRPLDMSLGSPRDNLRAATSFMVCRCHVRVQGSDKPSRHAVDMQVTTHVVSPSTSSGIQLCSLLLRTCAFSAFDHRVKEDSSHLPLSYILIRCFGPLSYLHPQSWTFGVLDMSFSPGWLTNPEHRGRKSQIYSSWKVSCRGNDLPEYSVCLGV